MDRCAKLGAAVLVWPWRRGGVGIRVLLGTTPIACLIFLEWSLRRWAAHEVREAGIYQVLFLAAGAAWMTFLVRAMPLLGIDLRGDAIERANPAATIAGCGALVGVTLCFAGANVGEGATIWMTFFPAVLNTAALLACWIVAGMLSGSTNAISIDRDIASGARLAGFLVADGLILGRAGAGDWISMQGTIHDLLRLGWPAAALIVPFVIVQWIAGPSPRRPQPGLFLSGLVPGSAFIALAVLWFVHVRER